MKEAIKLARAAFSNNEVPIGAIVVDKNKEIIGKGYNKVETENNCTNHAEIIAIKEASKNIKNWRLDGCSIYVTCEPCTMCIGAIINSRIKNLYFGCYEPKTGAVGSIYDLSKSINVYPELLKNECSELLSNFFKNKRQSKAVNLTFDQN